MRTEAKRAAEDNIGQKRHSTYVHILMHQNKKYAYIYIYKLSRMYLVTFNELFLTSSTFVYHLKLNYIF